MPTGFRALGELALRVNDLEAMKTFYRDVVGLEVFDESIPGAVFFVVAEAAEGHPQTLVLFDRRTDVGQERTTLDHFAFLVEPEEQDDHRCRVEELGITTRTREFPHFRWGGVSFEDPEGNTLELVCSDPTLA